LTPYDCTTDIAAADDLVCVPEAIEQASLVVRVTHAVHRVTRTLDDERATVVVKPGYGSSLDPFPRLPYASNLNLLCTILDGCAGEAERARHL